MALNTVESIEAFSSEILQGHWDNVLRIVSQLKIPEKKLMDLYEQVKHVARYDPAKVGIT